MNLKREDELLLDCLRADSDQVSTSGLERLTAWDWDGVIEQSGRHFVTPLLYRRLKRFGQTVPIPAGVLRRLHETYLRTMVSNRVLYHRLSKVLKVLKDEGIPVIVLKGTHLGEVVYGNVGVRTVSDVDLLFKKEDLARGQKIMGTGYSALSSHLPLDIHWNIDLSIACLNIDIEKVWERAQPAVIADVEVLVLSPEDLLLHLCTHLSFHHLFQFAGLRTLCDIRETIKHYHTQMEWDQVWRRARNWGASNSVYLTLLFARDLLGAQVPDDVMEALEPDAFDPRVRTWAMEQIFHDTDDTLALSPYFWQLWKPGPFQEKAALFRKLLFPSPEFISQKYPTSFEPIRNYLYYLVRLKDHFMRYTGAMWRILLRDDEMRLLVKRQIRNIAMREWLSSDKKPMRSMDCRDSETL